MASRPSYCSQPARLRSSSPPGCPQSRCANSWSLHAVSRASSTTLLPATEVRSISRWSCSSSTRASTSCTSRTRDRGARSPVFPDVPTLRELGLPDLEVDTWYGMFAPAGTPGAVVARLNAELNPLLKQPEVRELLAKQGMAAAGGTPERFGDLVKRELARWSLVVAKAGIKAD